jgi:hypothetical protein
VEHEIIERTLRFVQKSDSSPIDFNAHALTLFRYQFEFNRPYQAYCRAQGKTPRLVKSWRDIPAVPIDAFKEVTLSCSDPDHAAAVFMTSGTTTGNRGKHYHPSLDVYDLSTLTYFKQRFMGDTEKLPMGILFPTPQALPNSSLAHYLSIIVNAYGTADSDYFIDDSGLQLERLLAELEKREADNQPYALLGASFSFVHLFAALEKLGRNFALPTGSKVLDTGGYKNQSAELDAETFYQKMHDYLGVERCSCINMFGMTELSTQLYNDGSATLPAVITGPHWLKTRVVHPATGEDMPEGEPGVLVQVDLANFNSVSAILTEDMGVKKDNGFIFLGRVQGAEAKGCSLALDEFIHSVQGTAR